MSIYAAPKQIDNTDDCFFYHKMDVPGHPDVGNGGTDLRGNIDAYLGRVNLKGKRVLEVGTTDGYICFHMEKQGAEVVAYDLSEDYNWDIVPFAGVDWQQDIEDYKSHLRQINNSFWFGHRAFNSQAKLVHGTVYEIPEAIGPVDVTTFGCVLIHLRDPFLALQNALRLTKETVIITDTTLMRWFNPLRLAHRLVGPYAMFIPQFKKRHPNNSWWLLTPALIQQFIGVLGFGDSKVTFHYQTIGYDNPKKMFHYTVVGHRTAGSVLYPED